MSKVMLLGSENTHITECSDALIELGCALVVVASEVLEQAGSQSLVQVCANPWSTLGRGQVGDLLRQRGPFDLVCHCMPTAGAPFAISGLDEDRLLLQALSLHVSVLKGMDHSRQAQLVSIRNTRAPEALDLAVSGFLAGMAEGLAEDSAVVMKDLQNHDDDWSVAAIGALLSPLLAPERAEGVEGSST